MIYFRIPYINLAELAESAELAELAESLRSGKFGLILNFGC